MRLIHAQTRKVSLKSDQKRYNLARIQEIVQIVVNQRKVSSSMNQWEKNQDPHEHKEEPENFTPRFPEKYLHVLECDDITIASNIDRIEGLDGVSVALICAAAAHPGGEVLDGGLENEEELYRRTDIERHTQDYTIGMAVYPLCISKLEEGRAMLVQGASCYRADREFGVPMAARGIAYERDPGGTTVEASIVWHKQQLFQRS